MNKKLLFGVGAMVMWIVKTAGAAGFDIYPSTLNASNTDVMVLERTMDDGTRRTYKIKATNFLTSPVVTDTFSRGELLYVDPTSSYEGTPTRGDYRRPWLNLSNACYAVSNGETIYCLNGSETVRGKGNHSVASYDADIHLYRKTNITVSAEDGFLITSTNHSNVISVDYCQGVTLYNLRISAFKSPTNPYPSYVSNAAAIYLGTNLNITIDRCSIYQAERHGIFSASYGSKNVIVRNCYIANVGSTNVVGGRQSTDGSAIAGVTQGWVINNNFIERAAAACVEIENFNDPNFPLKDILISDNKLVVSGISGITVQGSSTNVDSIIIKGNIISSNNIFPTRIIDNSPSFLGIELYGARNTIVSDNVIKGLGYGVYMLSGANNTNRNVVIRGNSITDCMLNGVSAASVVRAPGLAIIGNTFDNVAYDDIIVHSITDFVIANNLHYEKTKLATAYAIHIAAYVSTVSNVLVTGNIAVGTGDRGIGLENGVTNVCLWNNYMTLSAGIPMTNFGGVLTCHTNGSVFVQ